MATERRKGVKEPQVITGDILDEDEQERILNDLRNQSSNQSRWARSALSILIGFVWTVAAFQLYGTLVDPTKGLAFQTNVESPLNGRELIFTFVLQCIALLCAVIVVRGKLTLYRMVATALGLSASLIVLVVWSRIIFDPELPLFMLWVPVSGPTFLAITWYVDYDLRRVDEDVKELAGLRYNFKKV